MAEYISREKDKSSLNFHSGIAGQVKKGTQSQKQMSQPKVIKLSSKAAQRGGQQMQVVPAKVINSTTQSFAKSTLSIHNLSSQRVIPPNSVLTQKMGNGNYVSVPITTIKSPA